MFFNLFKNNNALIEEYAKKLTNGILQKSSASMPTVFQNAKNFAKENNFSYKEENKGKNIVLNNLKTFISDSFELSYDDYAKFEYVFKQLPMFQNEINELLATINKKTIITNIRQNGVSEKVNDLGINLRRNEKLYYSAPARYIKEQKSTKRVNYDGFTGSIKIAKGVKYRIGTISPNRVTETSFVPVDTGKIYVTDKRIGFVGNKNFSVDFSKLLKTAQSENYFFIFKDGRESPYIIETNELLILEETLKSMQA